MGRSEEVIRSKGLKLEKKAVSILKNKKNYFIGLLNS
jgi:hypothetical protein